MPCFSSVFAYYLCDFMIQDTLLLLSLVNVSVVFCYWGFFFVYLFVFRAAPMAYGGSQARGHIGATAASLFHSHRKARSEPCLQPTPQLMAMPDP